MNETRSGATPAELALHERLLARDPTAPDEAANRFLLPVTERLLRARPDVRDEQLVAQAAIDAIFSYVQRPQQFDPARATLERYLRMSAGRDLDNALAKERRHSLRAVSLDDDPPPSVELSLAQRNESVEDRVIERIEVTLPPGLDRAQALRLIMQAFPEPSDRRLLQLRLDGVRRTEPYAAALGLSDRPVAEQRLAAKRAKDRIDKRLERLRARLGMPSAPPSTSSG